ncbi:hypothetical protein QBC36DRAFT_337169 [Triangularia setosa]|uniref:Uncharacterized protein n=1 Tax=Triangularia setosa TaxID=2587417 RepID=A0AAN6W0P6_9PEZI|nr:hypothetical protein QBC36DRAFT_337169 [Podospora setosa]
MSPTGQRERGEGRERHVAMVVNECRREWSHLDTQRIIWSELFSGENAGVLDESVWGKSTHIHNPPQTPEAAANKNVLELRRWAEICLILRETAQAIHSSTAIFLHTASGEVATVAVECSRPAPHRCVYGVTSGVLVSVSRQQQFRSDQIRSESGSDNYSTPDIRYIHPLQLRRRKMRCRLPCRAGFHLPCCSCLVPMPWLILQPRNRRARELLSAGGIMRLCGARQSSSFTMPPARRRKLGRPVKHDCVSMTRISRPYEPFPSSVPPISALARSKSVPGSASTHHHQNVLRSGMASRSIPPLVRCLPDAVVRYTTLTQV